MAQVAIHTRTTTTQRTGDRDAMIVAGMPLARALARRYEHRGEPLDDLEQAAMIGLIKAVDGFDPQRGGDFRSFATPTILGEVRRHFRDRTWSMRVPRGVKENHARVVAVTAALTQTLGRAPTVAEIADDCGLPEEAVLDAVGAHTAYRPDSLSWAGPDDEGDEIDIAVSDAGYRQAEARADLCGPLATLAPRERLIIHLRFHRGLAQSEIASIVGVSQMHVSRLIARSLDQMREAAAQ